MAEAQQVQTPKIEFHYDRSLRRHAIRITGLPAMRKGQLTAIHGVLSVVEDGGGWTIYLKPACDRESTMQAVEAALGVTR